MVKVVDMAWIGDRSLDIYCEQFASNGSSPPRGRHASSAAKSIFESVMDSAVESYSCRYDMTLMVVPCYPLTRMRNPSVITRFVCRNSDFLSDIGVSSIQFLERFDKFIMSKCRNEYATECGRHTYLLNARGALFHDWMDTIRQHFGSSLVDGDRDAPFDTNPGFVRTMEDDLSIFVPVDESLRYKLREAVSRIVAS